MEGKGDRALGVGVPEPGKVSASEGKDGGKEAPREFWRSMMGGSWDW